jgi:hypothetical protein
MPQSINYHFTQRFSQPAHKAYKWCTGFTPQDQALMGEKNATRKVQKIAENTVILKDEFHAESGTVTKHKLVCLYPKRLMWTSTHLTGPAKHSQFIYEITATSKKTSILSFTALHIAYHIKENTEKTEAKVLSEKLRKEDSNVWKDLAAQMKKELRKGQP